jgi:predicted lipid-binding transport protein (Tim44 family)
MAENKLTNPNPQFSTAEYTGKPGTDTCKSCQQTISGEYYRISGALACANCADQLKRQIPKDSHSAFVRGILFGVGGAILGLILYSAFGIITGLVIGYISLAVGYIVGRAIKMGSGGIGGRRYQIAAVILTYAAVSIAAIPIYVSQAIKEKKEQKQGLVKHSAPPVLAPAPQQASPSSDKESTEKSAEDPESKEPKMGLGAAVGMMMLVGLASPFLELQDPIHGGIGLIILFVGIRIAWKMTAGSPIDILGPFNMGAPTESIAR